MDVNKLSHILIDKHTNIEVMLIVQFVEVEKSIDWDLNVFIIM